MERHLTGAPVVLVLISASYLASDYLHDVELKLALERARAGKARVIAVLLRACDWKAGAFAALQVLPRSELPITSWPNSDEAWREVVLGIREAIGHPAVLNAGRELAYERNEIPVMADQLARAKERRGALQRLEMVTETIDQEIITRQTPPAVDPVLQSSRLTRLSSRLNLVLIHGGTFWMGSARHEYGASGNERPRHQVTLSPYWMTRIPITEKLYSEVMNTTARPVQDDLPVTAVSWVDAISFCNRLSTLEGLVSAYREADGHWVWDRQANGYRLPTEAEWEYGARGADGRAYPWGNEPPSDQLSWNGEGNEAGKGERAAPSPVGSYPRGASPFGLLDMAGNVWEWCWDWYAPYPPESNTIQQDPRGPDKPAGESRRVIRGGGWDDVDAFWVRAATRTSDGVSAHGNCLGFRCARGSK
jgi:formylglycine-generating enzyme required for sulfatase activity